MSDPLSELNPADAMPETFGWLFAAEAAVGDFRRDIERAGLGGMYRPGDPVVYTTTKHSVHPGPRAEAVQPEPHGEGYYYDVRKYWRVLNVNPGGELVVVTRRGKQRTVPSSDPRLRPARWWESIFFSSRFPKSGGGPSNRVASELRVSSGYKQS